MTVPIFIMIAVVVIIIFEEFGFLIVFGLFLMFADDLLKDDEPAPSPKPVVEEVVELKRLPHLDVIQEYDSAADSCDVYYTLVVDQHNNKMCVSVANY